jgi:hypothetical protein
MMEKPSEHVSTVWFLLKWTLKTKAKISTIGIATSN